MHFIWTFRSVVSSLIFVVLTFALSASAILCSFFTNSPRMGRLHMKLWGRTACFLFGVRVQVKGFEHWSFQNGAVVLFNHTSFFDIFAMSGYLPDMRFGAKKELFKIPLFGAAMKRIGILPIDRARRDRVFKVYQQSAERLQSGEKIALAPEGGRTDSPREIGSFKSGPFIFALQAQVPIVPVVISGAYEVMPKGAIVPNAQQRSRILQLEILPAIPLSDQSIEKRTELQGNVRSLMQSALSQHYIGVQ